MERKSKEIQAKEGPTSLARTTVSPFAWLDDMDRWFGNFRRSFEDRFWGGPLTRWTDSDLRVREPLVDLIDKGSEFVVRAELPALRRRMSTSPSPRTGSRSAQRRTAPGRRRRRTTSTASGRTRPSGAC